MKTIKNNINEECHVPDINNISNLIDEIVYICKYHLYNELCNKLERRNFEPDFYINYDISFSDLPYIPEWLDSDTELNISIRMIKVDNGELHENEFGGDFKLNNLKNNNDKKFKNYIEPNDDCIEFPTRLCNGEFEIVDDDYYYKDLLDIDNMFSEIGESIMHEFEHAYEKYKRLSGSSLYSYDRIISESDQYNISQTKINNIIKTKAKVNDKGLHIKVSDDEYNLALMMYYLMYTERQANIASLYEKVRSELPSPRSVVLYKTYKIYNDCRERILKFNDEQLYNEYKKDIMNLFGKTTSNIQRFRNKLNMCCTQTIKRLYDVYYKAKTHINNTKIKFDMSEIDKKYKEFKRLYIENMCNGVSESELSNYEINANKYVLSEFEMIRSIILKQK